MKGEEGYSGGICGVMQCVVRVAPVNPRTWLPPPPLTLRAPTTIYPPALLEVLQEMAFYPFDSFLFFLKRKFAAKGEIAFLFMCEWAEGWYCYVGRECGILLTNCVNGLKAGNSLTDWFKYAFVETVCVRFQAIESPPDSFILHR